MSRFGLSDESVVYGEDFEEEVDPVACELDDCPGCPVCADVSDEEW